MLGMASHAQGQLLTQVVLTDTSIVSAFASLQLRVEITLIMAVVEAPATLTVYHDNVAAGFLPSQRILISELTTANDGVVFQAQHPGSGIFVQSKGLIGLQGDGVNDITCSVYGVTETRAERSSRG